MVNVVHDRPRRPEPSRHRQEPGTDHPDATPASTDVYGRLGTRPTGLTTSEVDTRRQRVGLNELSTVRSVPLHRKLIGNFTHFMALLLWAAALVALGAGLPQLAVAVVTVNVINGAFSFWQEFKAEKATEALKRLLPVTARVVRDGAETAIPADQLVPGDVVILTEGDRVSADAHLVQAVELRVDQSTLTGESHPVRKLAVPMAGPGPSTPDAASDVVFAGTSVAAGRGRAVVTAIGMDTQFGRVAALTQGTPPAPSPLQIELKKLSVTVGTIAVSVGLVFLALALLLTPMTPSTAFVFTLGMIVAFVPEGLLPTVTLALAMATQRMAHRHALVKRLSAVEALGSTTVICTDKTGTLTTNEMTVRGVWTPTGAYELTGAGYDPAGETRSVDGPAAPVTGADDTAAPTDLATLLRAGALVNDAKLRPPSGPDGRWGILGDPMEAAIKVAAVKVGIDIEANAAAAPRIAEAPFDSVRKRMSTIHQVDGRTILCCKGAPRELLARCTSVRLRGRDQALTDEVRQQAEAANDAYSRNALRVLAVAVADLDAVPDTDDVDRLEQDMTFLGLVALLDPPHEEVAEALRTCRRAGIRVIMLTGDYGLTAESIARRVGLVTEPDLRIINGDELEVMDDTALAEVLQGEVLFARIAPHHKLRVVTALQSQGEVVAMTGDGVNDAPALKKADIGVAMGLSGTDVAKEAADLVLLDDNFATIVAAIEEGRGVYANIKKFTGYIFTSNTPEAVPFILFALSGGRIPIALGVMHILAIDLGTDLVPALALGAEPAEPGVMDQPPRPRNAHVISRPLLLRSYAWLGPLQAMAVMAAFYASYWTAGYQGQWLDLPDSGPVYAAATATALAAVVTTQIGNLFAHRSERLSAVQIRHRGSRLLWIGIASELVAIAAFVYLDPFQAVIGTAAIPLAHWPALLALTPLLWLVDEGRKLIVRRRGRHDRRTP